MSSTPEGAARSSLPDNRKHAVRKSQFGTPVREKRALCGQEEPAFERSAIIEKGISLENIPSWEKGFNHVLRGKKKGDGKESTKKTILVGRRGVSKGAVFSLQGVSSQTQDRGTSGPMRRVAFRQGGAFRTGWRGKVIRPSWGGGAKSQGGEKELPLLG